MIRKPLENVAKVEVSISSIFFLCYLHRPGGIIIVQRRYSWAAFGMRDTTI